VEVGTRSVPLNADQLDADVAVLHANAERWARLAIPDKIAHLRTLRARTVEVGPAWAMCAAGAKGIAASPLAGEEWLSGPYALLVAIDRLIVTLAALDGGAANALPAGAARLDARGRVAVDVFPLETSDRLLLSGVRATVVMQAGVTLDSLAHDTASFYANPSAAGRVTLVLGAGNIASIGPLDVLTALYAHGSVALLKLNPVNAYLEPFFAQIFGALINEGFVRVCAGGADVGAYLCAHDGIDAIHLTGGERTHDAIVFGTGVDAATRKRAADPLLRKPITSELGNVTPVIVVPGPWSAPDIAFQAAHVATMKLHNAGANCISAQILITSADDARTPRFVTAVRDALAAAPARPTYYPGSISRQAAITLKHPSAETLFPPGDGDARTFVPGLDPTDAHEPMFTDEAFGPVLGQTSLPGADAQTFLRNAVAFCNERLHGTLGASILIHPRTITELGPTFDEIVADLRYGSIGINAWPGVGYLLATASWGAYPGNTIGDAGSGIGVVHNACLFDRPETTIVRAPFAPFPRSLGDGEWTLLPTPPWFVNHHRAQEVGRRLFAFTAAPSSAGLAATAIAALRS
jgi:acyl-CoA reductase-like NAD-dependent aldehyde dehydrogenase